MEITIDDSKKIISVWCAKSEKADIPVGRYAKAQQYKGYTIAVFCSGSQDLFEGTKNLLLHNRSFSSIATRTTAPSRPSER